MEILETKISEQLELKTNKSAIYTEQKLEHLQSKLLAQLKDGFLKFQDILKYIKFDNYNYKIVHT